MADIVKIKIPNGSSYTLKDLTAVTNITYDSSNHKLQKTINGNTSDIPIPLASTNTDGMMSAQDKYKLNGIANGAQVNVQSDWNAVSGDAQILNKPTIPTKTSELTNDSGFLTSHQDITGKQDTLVSGENIKTINNESILGEGNITIQNGTDITVDSELSSTSENPVQNKVIKSALDGKVSTASGKGLSTNDFTNAYKTKLDGIASGAEVNVQSDWNAVSGDAQILNKPTIPTKTSQLNNDSGFLTSHQDITGKQDVLVSGTNIKTINNESLLGSGNITIQGGGSITVDTALSSTSQNPVQNKVINSALEGKVNVVSGKGLSTNDYTTTEKDKLSGIASGAEVNVINSISVNNSTVTPSNKSVNISVPTNVSDLTNDLGFITDADIPEGAAAYTGIISSVSTATSNGTANGFARGDHVHSINNNTITSALGYTPYNSTNPNGYITINDINIPTKTSDLTNDSGFLTSYTETDPVYSTSPAASITANNISNWNNKADKTLATSTSDGLMSSSDKNKLNGIASEAQVNVIDSIQVNNSSASISNKTAFITIPTKTSDLTNDSGYITSYTETDPVYSASPASNITTNDISNWNGKADTTVATTTSDGLMSYLDKWKLDGIESGAEVNVQSDWNATSGDALILNKPTIPSYSTFDGTNTGLVPQPESDYTANYSFLSGDGSWNLLNTDYIDVPGYDNLTTIMTGVLGRTESATSSSLGVVKVPTTNGLSVDNTGAISIAQGSTSSKGVVQVTNGNGLSINNGTVSMALATSSSNGAINYQDYNWLNTLRTIYPPDIKVMVIASGSTSASTVLRSGTVSGGLIGAYDDITGESLIIDFAQSAAIGGTITASIASSYEHKIRIYYSEVLI